MAVLTRDTFELVLTSELKRAARSQTFVTLVLVHPRGGEPAPAAAEIARLVDRELRETDLLSIDADAGAVSMGLLDADLQNAICVIDRVMSCLEHYQFSVPLDVEVGAACCPTHGADLGTLKRVAAAARTGRARRPPHGTAHAQ